ncbi:D-alanyl-D-alanine carboxypeptidase [Apibacter sp. ESL0404]|uniref:D-alanyl-D-alanine carboxypeptidase n=1 Tax=Apibacter sp. ESL0404 TaxID=2704651 RepID=UPI001C699388|nr:D-alanyl-D-alanine carboxypeptidase [Apibacter sp. ESL0404]QYN50719.1 D-alanyl-D-alanine carboxypeptidase [Apibacter sp. ESL0404]
MKKIFFIVYYILISISLYSQKTFLINHFDSDFYTKQWAGFYLYDPVQKKEIFNYNGNKYFIPASNVKIFTLYTGLKLISDSIPSLKYVSKNDTLYICGTGDPTLLEPYFKQNKVIEFLKNRKETIALFTKNFDDTIYGPGWSWEDYKEYFSPERTSFPMYGNLVTISSPTQVYPSYFINDVLLDHKEIVRDLRKNKFHYSDNKKMEIPFITSDSLTKILLERELNKSVYLTEKFPKEKPSYLYSIPGDSLYRRMMVVSDNFLAEQILLMGSLSISDKLNSSSAINLMLSSYLKDLPQKPRWVDGSGLSRYNNFTPKDMVYVLTKLYEEIPYKRLISLFPAGGVSGTLKNYYKGNPPYIFAKTGGMKGVSNLSGYLETNSGKVLIFSFMNNNFQGSSGEIKEKMQKVLEYVRDYY